MADWWPLTPEEQRADEEAAAREASQPVANTHARADRHPPILPERLAKFEFDADDRNLNLVAYNISAEARATKCEHIRLQDALLILVFERWERAILNDAERDRLLRRLYT